MKWWYIRSIVSDLQWWFCNDPFQLPNIRKISKIKMFYEIDILKAKITGFSNFFPEISRSDIDFTNSNNFTAQMHIAAYINTQYSVIIS